MLNVSLMWKRKKKRREESRGGLAKRGLPYIRLGFVCWRSRILDPREFEKEKQTDGMGLAVGNSRRFLSILFWVASA